MGRCFAVQLAFASLAVAPLVACTTTPPADPERSATPHTVPQTSTPPVGVDTAAPTTSAAPVAAPSSAASTSAPRTPAPLTGAKMSKLKTLESQIRATIPKGAGDYAHAVALATLFKRGDIGYEELESAIRDLKLPPHQLGDGYLMITPPPPPPGITFDPKMMPKDWEGNWGVVAQAYHLGELTKDQYVALHRAAHPDCKK